MKEVIAVRAGIATVALMLMGGSVIHGIGSQAGSDVWLAIIFAALFSLPFILIYARLGDFDPEQDIFHTLEKALGKPLTVVVAIIYGYYALLLMYYSLDSLGNFVTVAGLVETPKVVPRLALTLIGLMAAKAGIEVLTRWCSLFLRIIVLTSFLALVLVLKEVDFSNLQPVLFDGIGPVLQATLTTMKFPFLETVLFTFAGAGFRIKNGSRYVLVRGHFAAAALILFIITLTVAVVGPEIYRIQYYPVYGAVSRIDVGGFFTRLEITVTFIFLITAFVKVSVCQIVAAKCFSYLVGETDYRRLVTPLALSGIVGSFYLAEGTLEMEKRNLSLWPPLELAVQVILPVIIWIIAEIRLNKQNDTGQKAN